MNELSLELNHIYVTATGGKVKIVTEVTEDSLAYGDGYRFMADDGNLYTPNGQSFTPDLTLIGPAEPAAETFDGEADSMPFLVRPEEVASRPLALEVDRYFHNGLNQVVLIIGRILPGNRFYKRGFRFFDQRGSYYTADGSVKSRFYSDLNLTGAVLEQDVTPEQMEVIDREVATFVDKMNRRDKLVRDIDNVYRVVNPILCGANIGAGLVTVWSRPLLGMFGIGMGSAGLALQYGVGTPRDQAA